MEIDTLSSSRLEDVVGVKSFKEYLLVVENNFFKSVLVSYKNKRQPDNSFKLELEQTISNAIVFIEYTDFFVLHSEDINRTIIVVFSGPTTTVCDAEWKIIAQGVSPTHVSRRSSLFCVVWKNRYLVMVDMLVMRLKPTENAKNPYEITWDQLRKKYSSYYTDIFNIGDKYILEYRYSLPPTVFYHTWNEDKKQFQESSFHLEGLLDEGIDSLGSVLTWKDKILVSTCLANNSIRQGDVCVYDWNGKLQHRWPHTGGFLCVWDGFLVKTEKDFLSPNCDIKFLDITGQTLYKFQVHPIQKAVVWEKKLVLFYEDKLVDVLEINFWKVQRLLWLAWLKNKGVSPLAALPKEILKYIIQLLSQGPPLRLDEHLSKISTEEQFFKPLQLPSFPSNIKFQF